MMERFRSHAGERWGFFIVSVSAIHGSDFWFLARPVVGLFFHFIIIKLKIVVVKKIVQFSVPVVNSPVWNKS